MSQQKPNSEVAFITGFPSYIAKRMILKLLAADSQRQVIMLVQDQLLADADVFASALPADQQKRLNRITGDVASLDLGLSGEEYRQLLDEVTDIHHLADHLDLRAPKEIIQHVNVSGTRGVLEFALECHRLHHFHFWSTIHVSGNREGVMMENELECGQKFHTHYEHSKYIAEKIVRSMVHRLPITIFRPGIIVGDSQTGEIDRFDGPYHLIAFIVDAPLDVQLPLPVPGNSPLHLVPIDYVINAAYAISSMANSMGKTFHLVDPTPLSAKNVYQLVAERAHRKPPREMIPVGVAKALLKLPVVAKWSGSSGSLLEGFTHNVVYNCRNTLEALRPTDIWCPPLDSYVDRLIQYVKNVRSAKRQQR